MTEMNYNSSNPSEEPMPTGLEKGTQILITDLEVLLREAKDGEFGDFTNNKYSTPKIALANRLNELRQNVINGKYD